LGIIKISTNFRGLLALSLESARERRGIEAETDYFPPSFYSCETIPEVSARRVRKGGLISASRSIGFWPKKRSGIWNLEI
jgi:hypothetical protein